jgi:hypothetical protein
MHAVHAAYDACLPAAACPLALLQSREHFWLPLGAVTAGTSAWVRYSMHQVPSVPRQLCFIASVACRAGFPTARSDFAAAPAPAAADTAFATAAAACETAEGSSAATSTSAEAPSAPRNRGGASCSNRSGQMGQGAMA